MIEAMISAGNVVHSCIDAAHNGADGICAEPIQCEADKKEGIIGALGPHSTLHK